MWPKCCSCCPMLMSLAPLFLAFAVLQMVPSPAAANTECVWATGLLKCNKNQSKVLGAVVELWDLDSPQNAQFQNPLDSDDKAAFTEVDDPSGLWKLEGCASDHDWLAINRPEFYLRVHHECNTNVGGEWLTVMPVFRVYTPRTYDWHIEHPIVLDTPAVPTTAVFNNGTSALSSSPSVAVEQQQLFKVFGQTYPPLITMPPPPSLSGTTGGDNNAENDESIVSDGTRHNNNAK
uniref:Ricin B-type lectin domain-containing protein n=1 Tax=Globodera pallida TaxID=36090 RepID=A0A183BZE4_GLOPA